MTDIVADGTPRLPTAALPLAGDGVQPIPGMPTDAPSVTPTGSSISRRRTDQEVPRGRHYHTMLPRTMVVAACLAGFAWPLLIFILERQGHVDFADGEATADDHGRNLVIAATVGATICYTVGWVWWAVAAAVNARQKSRWSVSPWLAPVAFLVIMAASVVTPAAAQDASDNWKIALGGSFALIVLISHFGVLGSYRRAAEGIGAATKYWSRLIFLPWIAVGLGGFVGFFAQAVDLTFLVILEVLYLAIFGWYSLSMYQALSSFDRACIGRMSSHSDDGLPDFLKRGR